MLTEQQSVDLLLRHCGCKRPSWITITSFWQFLAYHFQRLVGNPFYMDEDMMQHGFQKFMSTFVVYCSRDFGTYTQDMTQEEVEEPNEAIIAYMSPRVNWEDSMHPYVLTNGMLTDNATFTFFGFAVDSDGMCVYLGCVAFVLCCVVLCYVVCDVRLLFCSFIRSHLLLCLGNFNISYRLHHSDIGSGHGAMVMARWQLVHKLRRCHQRPALCSVCC